MKVQKFRLFLIFTLPSIFFASCERQVNGPEPPKPDERLVRKIQDYEYLRFKYFFLDTLYRAQFRYYAHKWIHMYDVPQVFGKRGSAIYRIEVYKSRGGDDKDPRAIPGVAYRDPARQDSTEVHSGYFIRLDPNVDYYVEKALGYIVMAYPLSPEEVLAVAYQDSGHFYSGVSRTIGDIDYIPDPDFNQRRVIRLKLIKSRSPFPSQDRNHTWHLEWKNVYDLGSHNIPSAGFEVKIFFKPSVGAPQDFLTNPLGGGLPISYLRVFGLDERDATGASRPDDKIDNDPAILNLAKGELIFPDLEPFDPVGVIVFDNFSEPSKLALDKRVPTIYDSSIQAEIFRDSKFYIEVKHKDARGN